MNDQKRRLDFREAMSKVQALVAIVLVLAGVDALFTRLVLKHTSPVVGGALLIFGLLQVPALLKVWRSRSDASAPDRAMSLGTQMPTPTAPPANEFSMTALEHGLVIAQYGYKLANKLIGLFVTASFSAIGLELLFIHRFIPARPEGGLKIFAWASLILGGYGIISGIRSLLFPKPIIVVAEKGLTLNIAGMGRKGMTIPWSAIKSIKLTRMPSSSGGRLDALSLVLDPSFPLPRLFSYAALANKGELVIPMSTLNESPEKIYEKIHAAWSQYQPLS